MAPVAVTAEKQLQVYLCLSAIYCLVMETMIFPTYIYNIYISLHRHSCDQSHMDDNVKDSQTSRQSQTELICQGVCAAILVLLLLFVLLFCGGCRVWSWVCVHAFWNGGLQAVGCEPVCTRLADILRKRVRNGGRFV